MTLASRVTGLVRDLFMASMFGANALTDAFNVAFRIPNLFRRLFAEGAFSQAFVPVLAASHAKEGPERTHQLISNVATVLVWVLLVVCVLGVVGAPVLVWLLASGFQNQGEAQAAVLMTRWMFPYIGFMSLVALSSGVLNTYKHFAVPAATPVLLNLCMIGAAWLLAPWFERQGIEPIYAMCAGWWPVACCSWRCKFRCCGACTCCHGWAGAGRPFARPGPMAECGAFCN